MEVKVIPVSDAYREGWERVKWGGGGCDGDVDDKARGGLEPTEVHTLGDGGSIPPPATIGYGGMMSPFGPSYPVAVGVFRGRRDAA